MKINFHQRVLFHRQSLDFADAKPQNSKQKRMFRRFLAAGATVVMLTAAAMPSYAAAEKFTDVKPGSWYYEAVDYAVTEGLLMAHRLPRLPLVRP